MMATLKEYTGLITVMLGLLGLLWQAAQQASTVDAHGARISAIESTSRQDHDTITEMRGDLKYLVREQQKREAAR